MENKEYYTPDDLDNEVWVDVKGFEELYQISNLGRVKRKPFILKVCKDKDNYPKVTLSDQKRGVKINKMIHRLIAEHFIPNSENKKTVNHKDGIKENNSIENLEWMTYSENTLHAYKIGLYGENANKWESNPNSKLTKKEVLHIKSLIKQGVKSSKIQKEHYPNISWNTINNIKNNKIWKNL